METTYPRKRPPAAALAALGIAIAYVALALADGGSSVQLVAALTVSVWWVVIVGVAFGILPRAPIPGAALAAGALLAGLAVFAALSIAWAGDNGKAFAETVRVCGYLGLFALVVALSPRASARTWLTGLALGLAAVTALALGSRLQPFLPGSDADIARAIPAAEGRLSYPIGYWNGLAALMALAIVLLGWLGAQASTRAGRAAAVAGLPAAALAIYLTSSRGGAVAAAIGLAVLIARGPARASLAGAIALGGAGAALLVGFASTRDELVDGLTSGAGARQGDELTFALVAVVGAVAAARFVLDRRLAAASVPRGLGRAAVAALAVGLVAAALFADPVETWNDFKAPPEAGRATGGPQGHFAQVSGSGRYQFWSAAWEAFEDDPLKGTGAGGYETWWNRHGSIARIVLDAHSLFLEQLAELGLVGLLLVAGFLATGAIAARRDSIGPAADGASGAALALLATGVAAASVDWTWELPAAFAPVVVAVALLSGPAILRREEPRVPGSNGAGAPGSAAEPPSRYGWGVATLVAGWAALWAAGVLFFAEARMESSREAARAGDLPAAARAAADARTLEPWAAEPRLQLALVEELAGDLDAARGELDDAIERAPEDWRLWLIAARIEVGAGDVEAAEAALERARELNPRETLLRTARSQAGP